MAMRKASVMMENGQLTSGIWSTGVKERCFSACQKLFVEAESNAKVPLFKLEGSKCYMKATLGQGQRSKEVQMGQQWLLCYVKATLGQG